MLQALDYIGALIGSLLIISLMAGVLLWVYRNFLAPEMARLNEGESDAPAIKAASSLGDVFGELVKNPQRIDDDVLSQTHSQLLGLASITTNLYDRYSLANDEARRLRALLKHFKEEENKVTLKAPIAYMAACEGIQDQSVAIRISDETTAKVQPKRVYLAIRKAAALEGKKARGYRQTAEQVFDEVDRIRGLVADIQVHIRTHNAAILVNNINEDLDKVARMLKIDGEQKTIQDYVESF